jgi:CheY-like chemotaxis protein
MAEKKKILIIDDEDDVCQIIKESFEQLGYEVLIAGEGGGGIKRTAEEKPDCVLLDIRIPNGMDGLTYLRKIRSYSHEDPQEQARIRSTVVIVLTGDGISKKAIFEMEGISGFIEKPFEIKSLHSKIQSILKLR